jgi:glycosyltransferase A (GT-A) superfamily protein (DUF2064 family)
MRARIVVVAKAPVPGRSKTRLCPPLTPTIAAYVAEAALADSLTTVASIPGRRPLLALDGEPGPWLPPGFEIVPQRGEGLGRRIEAAFEDAGGPALVIGMDTPQATTAILVSALETLHRPGTDAVFGRAVDGGWWALGLRCSARGILAGIPTSTPATGAMQLARLVELGLRVRALPTMRDVDGMADAIAVARDAPDGRFAQAVGEALHAIRAAESAA